jgi:serine phosphatase RsbU (regulator of sigma subunit)
MAKPPSQPPPVPPVDERQRLREHIAKEPGFRVTTVDTLNWICPYTLLVVPSPFDPVETAVESLMERRPWTAGKPRSLAEIQVARWSLWLRERLPTEPRLRIFAEDGRWLNPFTGEWLGGLPQAPAAALLEALTTVLTTCGPAQGGALLPPARLDELVRRQRAESRASDEIPAPDRRTSNPIGTSSGLLRPATGPATSSVFRAPAAAPAPAPAPPATDLQRARTVIERMLPPIPQLEGCTLAVHYEPMQGIGGDFYDFITLGDGRWLMMMGDVSGHGPEAALVVSAGLKALRMLAPVHRDDVVGLLAALNDNLRPDLPAGHFITCWAAVLDTRKRTLVAVCAGHHPALLCSLVRPITMQQVGHKGAAIGVTSGSTLRSTLKPDHVQLRDGDLLLQFTDGLFEVHNAQGVEFGRLRCMGSCVANLEHPPATLIARMVKEIRKFAGGPLDDDLTVLALAAVAPPAA